MRLFKVTLNGTDISQAWFTTVINSNQKKQYFVENFDINKNGENY